MSKFGSSPIEKIVQQQKEHFFATKNPSFVMGVSGGPDSMCLLHILQKLDVPLHIVHINYQKRGAASDKDAELVAKTARKFDIDCKTITVDPAEAEGRNFQQWAREVRYSAFELVADQMQANGIVTAHHQDDQIETILQKIFHGSGLASWSAMQVWDGHLFRPLLNVSRDQIETYCRDQSIDYRHDESNFSSDFARNFLRNEWLPELEQHFPGWRRNVLRVAEQADIFGSSLRYILNEITDEKNCLSRTDFLQLDEKLQKSVLIYYVNQVDKDAEISRGALNELDKLEELQTGKSIQLTESMELMRDRDVLKLVVDTGETDVFLTLRREEIEEAAISFNGLQFEIQEFHNPDFEHCLYLDQDAISWPLHIRKWKKGDRFQPLGMTGHQSVADHLTNRKVSATEKPDALVLESFEETICAVIFPPIEKKQPPGTIADALKCKETTTRCLTIKHIL
ncbi:MAG TPA: tRNA lysidine(34) synthetase TilS [Balneolaceae bacterium]|nr:tRNA lysidine(34) synthetase TilS [Balneolaceae bacterium]